MSEPLFLEGLVSIRAALESGSREILSISVRQDLIDSEFARLEMRAAKSGIPIERVSEEAINLLVGGSTHGGIVAKVGPRIFASRDDLLTKAPNPFIVMLDGIEDPFNFGHAVRALYAAGADGLVVRPRNWTSSAAIVARASAGASERMPMAIAESANEAAEYFRAKGLKILCTGQEKSVPLYDADLCQPMFILIGGEKRGITRSFADQADMVIEIPYARKWNQSLGAVSAAAVLGFEVARQRNLI
jgi:23S rRNA (guanosine2251-2'-O)-methyltransferase